MTKSASKRYDLDWSKIGKLCKMHCTQKQIAGFYDIHVKTLERRVKTDLGVSWDEYSDLMKEGGKASLRLLQWQSAEAGSVPMQIFLGKQYLGQSDKQEYSGKDGKPIEHTVDVRRLEDIVNQFVARAGKK